MAERHTDEIERIMAMTDEEILATTTPQEIEAARRARDRAFAIMNREDPKLLERALGILHRLATEQTGWRAIFRRWYYSDEPLRNDAAKLVRDARFGMLMPINTRIVGDRD